MAHFFDFKGEYFGLTEADIEQNTETYGYNIYTKNEKKQESFSPLQVILSPSFILMFIAGVLSLFGTFFLTGILILLIDGAYAFAEIYFGIKSDKKLVDIKASTATKFRVIRGGKLEFIEKEFIVPEDLLVVGQGERVPADAYIQECRDLTADESIFTGSNKPVAKYTGAESKTELSQSFVYSGTTILSGIAVCKVSASGVDTKLYQKTGEKFSTRHYYTEMERTIRKMVPICSLIAATLALVSIILWLISGNGIVESALRGITLGLCFVPTGISSVIRFYYIKGASDMIAKAAVVKSVTDIEKLNSVGVLCIEKEGAISKGRLQVHSVYTRSEELFYKVGALACDPNSNDEAERAFMIKASFFDENIKDIYKESTFVEKIPDSNEVMSGALWDIGGQRLYCIKGTPEQILPLCRFKGDKLYRTQKKQQEYYAAGYRVMAIACADAAEKDCDATAGFSYTFVGFAALSAPLRDSVSHAVKTCQKAGVKVVMLTEDTPHEAVATAKVIGLEGKVITGKQISDSVKYGSDLTFDADIYARVKPEQKLYILDQLKKQGETVALTGTRTTDAESLEHADIGITISQHTAGSALEAADIIMNDDNLSSISELLTSARQVHRNIKRAFSAVISGYFAIILLTAMNLFGNSQLMLNPLLLALFTMVFLPLAGLAYRGNKRDSRGEMPPSDYVASRKFNLRFLGNTAIIGALCGGVGIASYMFMYDGSNPDFARSSSLVSFSICYALFSLFSLHYENPVKAVFTAEKNALINFGIIALLPLVLVYVPFINTAFGLCAIDGLALFISILTGLIPAIAYILIKTFIKFK